MANVCCWFRSSFRVADGFAKDWFREWIYRLCFFFRIFLPSFSNMGRMKSRTTHAAISGVMAFSLA